MKILYSLCIMSVFVSASSFITNTEYGKMLYQNPRGIGCNKCHGKDGEGSLIARYKSFNNKTKRYENKELRAPNIKNLSLNNFLQAMNKRNDIMPSYSLTRDEIIVLYNYLKTK